MTLEVRTRPGLAVLKMPRRYTFPIIGWFYRRRLMRQMKETLSYIGYSYYEVFPYEPLIIEVDE